MTIQATEQREKYPLPWIVGPSGSIWVAEDIEFRDGKWREKCPEPRLVLDVGHKPEAKVLAELIVRAVNATAAAPPPPY